MYLTISFRRDLIGQLHHPPQSLPRTLSLWSGLSQIDNHKERGDPAEDAELDEMILDKTLRGGAAEAEDNHVLEITQKTSQHPAAGKIDITGAHALDDLWRHGIHDVAYQCDGGNDGCGFIDKSFVIASDRNTGFGARLFIDPIVVVTFGEGQEKRHEESHHHKPMGDPNISRNTTYQHSHHKPNGNDRHIQDGILFQTDTVGDIHQPIAHHDHI